MAEVESDRALLTCLLAAALGNAGLAGFHAELAARGFAVVRADRITGLLEANNQAVEQRRALQQEVEQCRAALNAMATAVSTETAAKLAALAKAEQAANQAAAMLPGRLQAERERDEARRQREACLVATRESQKEQDALQERAETMRAMLVEAAATFDFYAEQHAAKGTAEGIGKAAVNQAKAEKCRHAAGIQQEAVA